MRRLKNEPLNSRTISPQRHRGTGEINRFALCLCASVVNTRSAQKEKASNEGRLILPKIKLYARGPTSFLTITGPLVIRPGALMLGQSRIPIAGQISPFAAGCNNCRKVCTP